MSQNNQIVTSNDGNHQFSNINGEQCAQDKINGNEEARGYEQSENSYIRKRIKNPVFGDQDGHLPILSTTQKEKNDRTIRSRNLVQGVFRSIRAAIMSRNMSHNIGSHVLSYLKIQLSNVGNIVNNQLLSDLVNLNSWNANSENQITVDATKLELPFLVGLGHFISLLQERQDYIATIATDYIPCFTPVDFKEAIFDGLNPDYKWIRHKEDPEREKGRHPKNILLEYIARSEGLTREESEDLGKLKFLYGYDIEKNDGNIEWKSIKGDAPKEIDFMRGKQISLPGGMMGRQAIFSIIENIIRNAAKHEIREKDMKDLNITLGLIDGDMVANGTTKGLSTELLEKFKGKQHVSDYWFLSISYPAANTKELKKSLENKLNTPFMNEDFDMDETNKGMKEIIISAAFLRRQSNLNGENIKEIVNSLTTTLINAKENDEIIAKNCKLRPNNGEPEFVYVDAQNVDGQDQISYVIPVRKVLPLMVCTDGMSDSDKELFNAKTDNCPWQICESIETFISESVKRGFEYYIVADREVYNMVRPYGTNRIVIWDERSDEMKEYWHGEETEFHHLMRIVSALHAKCSIHPDNEEEYIYIEDGKASSSHPIGTNQNTEKEMWTSHYGDINEEERKELHRLFNFHPAGKGKKVKYLYRTHLETSQNYKGYIESRIYDSKDYFQNDFIEGISGGNSTDRLLRREPYTFTTYTNHFHAAQSRVAIIDERIFKDIHGVDGSLCADKGINVKGDKAYRSLQFIQKGIDIFAIIPIKDGTVFALVGCIVLKNRQGKEIVGCRYCQLATLYFDDKFKLCFDSSDSFGRDYDYFAIHQGILDKLYEPFKHLVTAEGVEENNKEYKLDVTRTLYNYFMDSETISCLNGREDFLPNFIIHSGRGKCSEADMPQKLPFVSYAQMSHAINDCKLNLIQLFDYVRYEGD